MRETAYADRIMKIIVFGATGVVGRRVVPELALSGHHVSTTVRSKESGLALEKAGACPIQVNLFDRKALRAAVTGHDVVINLATHMPASILRTLLPGAWRENDRIRKVGSANLVDAALAAGTRRFIQESFAPVYSDHGDAWIDEDAPIAPMGCIRAIVIAEAASLRFRGAGGAGVVLRFGTFYGPDSRFTQNMINAVRSGWAPLPGPPDAYFSSISHEDAAAAVIAALDVPAGIYNVVDDEPLRRRDYANALAAALRVAAPRPVPPWLTALSGPIGKVMSRSQRIANRLLRWESSWRPKYPSLREGWAATVASMRDHDPFDRRQFSKRES